MRTKVQAFISNQVGRRGAALLFFALLDTVYCFALLTAPQPLTPFYTWMDSVLPLTAWGVAWGLVALVCLLYAFQTYDTTAFMAAVCIKVGWGLLALFGWLAGQVDRGYVSAVIWLGFAAFVFLIAGGVPPAAPRPVEVRWRWRLWTPS